ncbi:hypothetical protein GCM10011575_04280 [Microlunatus endophyticus]|uniref:Mannose-6-phosphate isomerase, class I n=1 Tax=Microlunatus endophyticus TaxID=1716077 RepID=A0A917W108_9ACTN|nr:class I mannose-6-phosphate isomerase [Microlunatus endophyticus]GGL49285.1 hypothetical protein GCM10011575_04280 [Microlunatus endophyticus]
MAQYVQQPHYPAAGAHAVRRGWAAAADTVPPGIRRLALDGPAMPHWDQVADQAAAVIRATTESEVRPVPTSTLARPWPEIVDLTGTPELADDPHFAKLAGGTIGDLMDLGRLADLSAGSPGAGSDSILLVYGPGAALTDPEVVWWADRPKRYAEEEVTGGAGVNLFQRPGTEATTKRLFYIDWPLLDRHRDATSDRIDLWIDLSDLDDPIWISGDGLRTTCATLARRPFRTLPTFNSTPWGGHWAQRELGMNLERTNTALGYELIAPESGVLIGDHPDLAVEIPFQLVVSRDPAGMMGADVRDRFGTSFPIRFDYLDTVDGGNLSVHTHPRPEFMREVFGWPYTQHETYYLMVGGPENLVYLGLHDQVDLDAFHDQAAAAHEQGRTFDIERFVQTFPATRHQLFLVPAGTPHGSGAGNVVLEVSATPYLYSLRFFDWLRTDGRGQQRPVHVEHAFANLDPQRRGRSVVDDLIQSPRTIVKEEGWQEELLGSLPEMFFEVRRLVIDPGAAAEQPDDGRFHVLTLVEGDSCRLETAAGDHDLHYAETIAVPAGVGGYRVRSTSNGRVRLVKALVKESGT